MKSRYVLVGGPVHGLAVETDSEASFVVIPVRTEEWHYNSVGEMVPVFDEAKYKLCGMTGEFVEKNQNAR